MGEQNLAHDHASFRFGLYNLNSEFDTNPTASIFLLSSHGIGPEFAHSGRNGPSIFPVTSLALRGEIKVGNHLHLRAAVLDGVPGDPAHPARTAVKLSARDGALGIGEAEYRDDRGKVGFGYWRYTAGFTDLLASAAAGRDVERRGNAGAYLLVERRLASDLSTPRGLAGWARIGVANGRFNPIGEYVGGGLVYTGALRSRGADQIGAALAWAEFGDRYRRAQTFLDQRRDAHEVIASATYLAPLTTWLSLQPNAAYVINPGGNPALRDALVLGLRVKVSR